MRKTRRIEVLTMPSTLMVAVVVARDKHIVVDAPGAPALGAGGDNATSAAAHHIHSPSVAVEK